MRGASMNHGPSYANGPLWPRDVPRPVAWWDFCEGRRPE